MVGWRGRVAVEAVAGGRVGRGGTGLGRYGVVVPT